mgnify:CR=1 FL=1
MVVYYPKSWMVNERLVKHKPSELSEYFKVSSSLFIWEKRIFLITWFVVAVHCSNKWLKPNYKPWNRRKIDYYNYCTTLILMPRCCKLAAWIWCDTGLKTQKLKRGIPETEEHGVYTGFPWEMWNIMVYLCLGKRRILRSHRTKHRKIGTDG